jgi:uncharacterized protein with GYD domain
MKQNSTDRVAEMRRKQKEKGHVRREYYATAGEHDEIKKLIKKLRK